MKTAEILVPFFLFSELFFSLNVCENTHTKHYQKNVMSDQDFCGSINPYEFMKIILNPDGSLTRLAVMPTVPPTPNPSGLTDSELALSKDIHRQNSILLRLFRPLDVAPATKLPLLIYFHGGGFVFNSATSVLFHDTCNRLASHFPALVLSVDYHLSPENPLPDAYNDAMEAIAWVQDQAKDINCSSGDPWLKEFADFSKIFLMGTSSGGNIAYNAGLLALDMDIPPTSIIGLIIIQGYFGGVERTPSELRLVDDEIIPLAVNDLMWSFALPEGSDRDHEYCNPFVKSSSSSLKKIEQLPKCFVRGYGGDPLVDRQKELGKMLQEHRVNVVAKFDEEGCHGVEFRDPVKATALYNEVKDFINSAAYQNSEYDSI